MNNRRAGTVIILLSVVMLILMLSITDELNRSIHADCACEDGVCPMSSNLPYQSYIGFTLILVMGGFGGTLVLTGSREEKAAKESQKARDSRVKSLNPEERSVLEKVKDSDGVMFQAELVEQTGFSKVKVTRILDNLEHAGLVERRRRGMSNVVVSRN